MPPLSGAFVLPSSLSLSRALSECPAPHPVARPFRRGRSCCGSKKRCDLAPVSPREMRSARDACRHTTWR
eukprot:2291534-Pleurochrysis_carterae.AAC.1